jgi:predicted AAA+ superfamily ATPase
MRRYAVQRLEDWKQASHRKPLLIYGARQVGKTWLVRDFAATHYDNLIELNFWRLRGEICWRKQSNSAILRL